MNTHPSHLRESAAHAEILEARFGLRVSSHLHEGSRELPHDISERLRVARMQAVDRARTAQRKSKATAVAAPVVAVGGGVAALGRLGNPMFTGDPWWARIASVLPIVVLLIGLFSVSELMTEEQISSAAQVDAELLGDDLPPAAYNDPGFAEFVQNAPEGAAAGH